MDIVESSLDTINAKLIELEQLEDANPEPDISTQGPNNSIDFCFTDTDKNLTKILNQQSHLKRIIDQDNHIQMLKNALCRVAIEIEGVRRNCTKLNEEALKNRQELAQSQAKEVERYQMNQIRSISEDYTRHMDILEQRKKEIQTLKREIEREEKERDAFLKDVEKKLDKQLMDRQKTLRGSSLTLTSNLSCMTDELHNPDHIELTSIDEYAPYGAAPHSRLPQASTFGSSRGGRGRGRRRRG